MPNIFPPIQLSQPVLDGTIQPQDNVPVPSGPLGSVSAPSGASLALNGADSTLQDAQDKYASDAPKKYDYSAHGVLGNIGHVLARSANIVGDVLDPAATSLIPNSDLYNAHKRAGDLEELQNAQAKQLEAQRESDSVGNEQANREEKGSEASDKNDTAQQKVNAQLAQHGYKMGANGIEPLSYEEMSPQQKAITDLKGAQQEQAEATADLKKAQTTNQPTLMAQAQQRLQIAQQKANTANAALGLHAQEFGFNQDKFYNPQPTAVERNKGDLAQSSIHQIGEMRDVIDKRPDIFGPGPGRGNKIQQWIGSSDPDAIKYRSSSQYLADHSAGLFGARGEYIMKQLHDLTDERFGPDALKQALSEADKTSQGFVNAGTTHGKGGHSSYSTPAGGGGKADYVFKDGKLVKQ